MPQSALVHAEDVRRIARLLGECRDRGDDPVAWREYLLAELARTSGAVLGVGQGGRQVDGVPQTHDGVAVVGLGPGRLDPRAFDAAVGVLAARGLTFHPAVPALVARTRDSPRLLATRPGLVPDREWYGSPFVADFLRPLGVDHHLFSLAADPVRGGSDGLVLARAPRDPDFPERAVHVVGLAHDEAARLLGGPLAGFGEPSPTDLSPRTRAVMRCILEGDSDKQIAARLRLSPFTVNGHTKRIYAHFGVAGRAELLARWVRRGWKGLAGWFDRLADGSGPTGEDGPDDGTRRNGAAPRTRPG